MKRDGFGTRIGALLALVGSAVGLGNLWKFPYMAGKNGGAAFILIYIGFMFILCLPLMLSEFIIGRRSQANAVGAFRKLAPNTKWYLTGVVGTVTAFIILSFYSVVGGWAIEYLVVYLSNGFSDTTNIGAHFSTFTQSPIKPVLYHIVFLGATVVVLWTGVKNGIERYSKILLPLLFIMIIGLAIFSLQLPGSGKGVEFMLMPNLSDITPNVILDALGQGLFSLSLGMGTVITYSSYMGRRENLTRMAIITILMDLAFAIIAGFVILPAVFSFGFQPDQGPGLLFIILPEVFAQMPFGNIFAIVFFIVLIIAALTSAISLLEVITAYLTEEKKMSRKKSLILSGSILIATGAMCSLSLGELSWLKILGNNIFDLFDKASSTYLMPIGAILISIFVGWKMKKSHVYEELSNKGTLKLKLFNLFIFLARYFVPIGIVVIILNMLGVFSF